MSSNPPNPAPTTMEIYKTSYNILVAENTQARNAVRENNTKKMERIFKRGISPAARDDFIFYARSVDMLKLFLRFGGDIHTPGPPGWPGPLPFLNMLLMDDALVRNESHRHTLVKFLVVDLGVEVNTLDCDGISPFVVCAKEGHLEICKFLVANGAAAYYTDQKKANALHSAAEYGHLDICQYLLEDMGFDIDALDVKRWTPL